jgi:hypothetical protein
MVCGLGGAWILDGLQITVASATTAIALGLAAFTVSAVLTLPRA